MTINSYFLDWILSFQFIRRIVEKHYIYSYEADGSLQDNIDMIVLIDKLCDQFIILCQLLHHGLF